MSGIGILPFGLVPYILKDSFTCGVFILFSSSDTQGLAPLTNQRLRATFIRDMANNGKKIFKIAFQLTTFIAEVHCLHESIFVGTSI